MTVFINRKQLESKSHLKSESKLFPSKEEALKSLSNVLSIDDAMALTDEKPIMCNNWIYRCIVTDEPWQPDFSLPSRFKKFRKS